MYIIKQIPEDFIVKEINNLKFDDNGQYSYYILKKRNYNTVDAIKKICEYFRIDEKYANFAGTKDRVAITEQYISISKGSKKNVELKDLSLEYVGSGFERINLGQLSGNYFEIVVRNIDNLPEEKKKFLNLFDSQRFGKNNDNQVVGKFILKGKYKEACELIDETKDFLLNQPNNFVGALRNLPKKNLKMYVHAYQSFLWNSVAKELSKEIKSNIKLPIVGFGTKFTDDKVKKIYENIMKNEDITFRDFINKSMPDLSEDGTVRDLYIIVDDLVICNLEDDDLIPDKKKVLLKFSLPPGAYATNVVKELFGEK